MNPVIPLNMKTLLITILALTSFHLNAQTWVPVPDAGFQTYLTSHYTAGAFSTSGGNFYIDSDHPDIQAEDSLNLNYIGIANLEGIQAFENIWFLSCYSCGINNLPDTLPALIRYLNLDYNQLTSLPALPPALKYLHCGFNQLTVIPDLPSNFRRLLCSDNQLTTLPDLPPLVNELGCHNNQLTVLPDLPPSLKGLTCANNQLTVLPDLPDSLLVLVCYNNQLTTLPDLPDHLTDLLCSTNQLTILPDLPSTLVALDCSLNQLIELTNLPGGLQNLWCNDNQITCFGEFPSSIQFFSGANGPFVCVPNHIAAMDVVFKASHPLCVENDPVNNPHNCPGASGIQGSTFYDSLSNCTTDGIYSHIPLLLFDDNSNLLLSGTSFSDGEYYFPAGPGSYEIRVDTTLLSSSIEVTCPQNNLSNTSVSAANPLANGGDFGLNCAGFDLGVQSIVPTGWVFPGQTHHVTVLAGDITALFGAYCAEGISGQVNVTVYGPGTMFFGGSPVNVSGTTATYNVSDFGALGANEFVVDILTDTTATAGNQFCVYVTVTTTASGETNTMNNDYMYCYDVINSYDPNNKETHPKIVDPGFTNEFTYTIHFQNTGNAPAFNIRLGDTLDLNLDLSTFKVVSASDAYTTTLNSDTRLLTVRFPNIMLPDSTTDPEGSIGYIQYRIKPVAGLSEGTVIENTAYIYFDYNTPIITNTSENLFSETAGVNEFKEEMIQLYPNPSDSQVFVRLEKGKIEHIAMYDLKGTLVKLITSGEKQVSIDVSNLKAGVYLISVQTDQSVITKRLIVR